MMWNFIIGCIKIFVGCKFCYVEVMLKWFKVMGVEKYKDNFKVRVYELFFKIFYIWKFLKVVFVNLMSDLFYEEIFLEYI